MSCEDLSHGIEAYPIICHAPGSQLTCVFKDIAVNISIFQLIVDFLARLHSVVCHCFLSDQLKYPYVKTNVPGPGINKDKFTEQFSGCTCNGPCTTKACLCLQLFGDTYDDSGKLKDLSSKPVLECGRACSCDPVFCTNRVVQQGIKTKLSVFHTKNKGFGLMLDGRNESAIPRLSFICEYAGEVVGHKEAVKRIQVTDATRQDNYLIAVKEHVFKTETCTYIDPRCIGNVGRFINHSCDPNLFMVPVRVNHQVPRLALFARKDIHPGEELTFDYSGSATLNASSDVMNVDLSPLSQDTTAASTADTQNSTMFQCDSLINRLTQLPESATDTTPPAKRLKFHQVGFTDNTLTPLISSIENECNFSLKNVINESKQKNEVADLLEMLNDKPAANGNISNADKTKSDMTADVKRKSCFCGSSSCTGFLPLDSSLMYD